MRRDGGEHLLCPAAGRADRAGAAHVGGRRGWHRQRDAARLRGGHAVRRAARRSAGEPRADARHVRTRGDGARRDGADADRGDAAGRSGRGGRYLGGRACAAAARCVARARGDARADDRQRHVRIARGHHAVQAGRQPDRRDRRLARGVRRSRRADGGNGAMACARAARTSADQRPQLRPDPRFDGATAGTRAPRCSGVPSITAWSSWCSACSGPRCRWN